MTTPVLTPAGSVRLERQNAIDDLIAAYEKNNIPVDPQTVIKIRRLPLHTIKNLTQHWLQAAKDNSEEELRARAFRNAEHPRFDYLHSTSIRGGERAQRASDLRYHG